MGEPETIEGLRAELGEARKDAALWKGHWQMYRDAWVRELGGWLVPKSHEIDALVLTTRKRCVNPLLGNCNTPHWLGKPTEDRKALTQTPHPRENSCKDWKFDDAVVEEIARLISEALKGWRSGDARYDSCKTTASVVVAILRPYFNRLTWPWYPIETAPKDGTEVLLRVKMRAGIPGKFLVGHWMPGGHCIEDHPAIDAGWYFWNGCMFDKASEPTQWSPLDGFLVAAPVRDAELKRLAIEACDGFDAQPNHGSPDAKKIMDALRNAAQGHTAVPVESFGDPWGGPDFAGNEPVTAPPCNCGAGVSARLYMHKTVCCWLRFVTSPTMNPPAPSQDRHVEFRVPNIEGHKPKE